MEDSTPTAFISYAHEDQEVALRLYEDLGEAGAVPWIDAQNLLPGQNWKNEIKKAIRRSHYFIAIFSKNSVNKKGFFQREVRMALEELQEMPPDQISFIPCRIEDVEIQYETLKDLHWLDLFPSYETQLRKLKLSIGITEPDRGELPDYRRLLKQMDQNLLRYKLAQTRHVLNEPFLFQNPSWKSEILIHTSKSLRRLYETLTRIQMQIPMYSYAAREVGNNRFVVTFKHDKEYAAFSRQLLTLFNNEGVQLLDNKTNKDQVPKGHSALVIPPNDAEAAMIRGSNGRSVYASSEGAFDADTGEKLTDEELRNLSPGGGFNITKS